eukprot:CAMPEP_0180530532 /NCGR_PEP_ID=MMETSP1036_2-20121128/61989_1 /TAXON_ID=632150 /ORGANISM="Azadinium spinosum, Strain 3D9" /LENGTH=34 /DNA_ID= /DNA_START= /DNA_END= /DNA_ORIENTATION=
MKANLMPPACPDAEGHEAEGRPEAPCVSQDLHLS